MGIVFFVENGPTKSVPSTELYPFLDPEDFQTPWQRFSDDGTPIEIVPDYPECDFSAANARSLLEVLQMPHNPDHLVGVILPGEFPTLRRRIIAANNSDLSQYTAERVVEARYFEGGISTGSIRLRLHKLQQLVEYAQRRNVPIHFG